MKKDEKKVTSRAAETRTKTERPKEYKPPSSLDAPPAPGVRITDFRHGGAGPKRGGRTAGRSLSPP